MRPDYCPMVNEPCQSMCDTPCSVNKLKAQSTWVGLKDEEIVFINDQHYNIAFRDFDADVAIAKAIEAKLKEKNT